MAAGGPPRESCCADAGAQDLALVICAFKPTPLLSKKGHPKAAVDHDSESQVSITSSVLVTAFELASTWHDMELTVVIGAEVLLQMCA